MPTFDPHRAVASDLLASHRALVEACSSREAFAELIARLASSADPEACPMLLAALGHLAGGAYEWLDGELAIELVEEEDGTLVQIMTELGGGMRERTFAPCKLAVPLSEFSAALAASPDLVGALRVKKSSWRRIALLSSDARRSTRPPRISDTSLVAQRHVSIAKSPPPSGLRPVAAPVRAPAPSNDEATLEALSSGWDDLGR